MAEALKNVVEVTLTDNEGEEHLFKLRYNLNALRLFEDMHKQSIMEAFAPSFDVHGNMLLDSNGNPVSLRLSVGMIADLIWVGTRKFHPDVKLEEIGDWLDMADAQEIMPMISEALKMSQKRKFPQEKIEGRAKKSTKTQ